MSETSKRDEAASTLYRIIDWSVDRIGPSMYDASMCVGMIIDAAKDELRAELDAGIKGAIPESCECVNPIPYRAKVAYCGVCGKDMHLESGRSAKEELRAELDAGIKARATDDEAWAFIRGDDAPQDAAARPAPECHVKVDPPASASYAIPQWGKPAPVGRVTCQCREPEAYIGELPGDEGECLSVICNQCGYKFASEEERGKLPARAPRRDFGTHLCLCDNPGYPPRSEPTRCGICKGSLLLSDRESAPAVMCG